MLPHRILQEKLFLECLMLDSSYSSRSGINSSLCGRMKHPEMNRDKNELGKGKEMCYRDLDVGD